MLRESDAAQEIFETVTAGIIRELGIEIKKQRIDSTHVLSDMAKFGRLNRSFVVARQSPSFLEHRRPTPTNPLEGKFPATILLLFVINVVGVRV